MIADPTGRLLTMIPDHRDHDTVLAEMASGRELKRFRFQLAGVSPGAEWLVQSVVEPGPGGMGFALLRGDAAAPLLVVGRDTWRAMIGAQFSRDGRLLVWGNSDSTISLCDVERLVRRLNDLGL